MNRRLTAVVGLLAVLGVTIYFRIYPVFFPQFNQSAERTIELKISQQIAQDINKKFPEFADPVKAKLFKVALADYKKNNRADIKRQVKEELAKLKDPFQDKSGQTYLMELDGWHWSRYVANIERLGHLGDEIIGGKEYDNLMLFPEGSFLLWNKFFFYFSWFCYKVFSFFKPVALLNFLFYLPLFFAALFTVLLYFFCYFNWGNIVAVICCLFVGTAPIFLPRSCAGWFDYDILTMMFPVLIIWSYLKVYSFSSRLRSMIWVFFSAFWLGLFCATWIGWSFILFIIVTYELLSVANLISERLQYKEKNWEVIKKHLIVLPIFFLLSLIWIVLLSGNQPVELLSQQVKDALVLNKSLVSSVWPNVLSTVGELKNGDYLSIARAVGGVYLLALVLVFMLGIFLNLKKYKGIKRELLIFLVIWFIVMFFFCSKGIRFVIFLLVPLGIFMGWGLQELYMFSLKKKWQFASLFVIFLFLILSFSMITRADSTARNIFPMMDDGWYSVLNTIKKYTPADSVINSWWDFGDWFKVVGNRKVIFDGQTQNKPQAYWMARVLITNSEKEAVGILRMLNNGGNKAFEIIDKYVDNPFMSLSLLKRAIMLPPEEGEALFLKYLPVPAVKEVKDILYSNPKQKVYFIVDSSMLSKMVPVSYLGNWDLIKVYLSNNINLKPKARILNDLAYLGVTLNQAEKYYQEAVLMGNGDFDNWISHRLSVTGIANQKRTDDALVLFNSGYIYNSGKKKIYSYSSYEEKYKTPKSLFLVEGDKISEEIYPESDANYSALLLEKKDMFKLVLLSPELAKSIFVRLYFLNGLGSDHFELFTQEGSGDNRILVFEVKWDK